MDRARYCHTPMVTNIDDSFIATHVDEAELQGIENILLGTGRMFAILELPQKAGDPSCGESIGEIREKSISFSMENAEENSPIPC